MDNEKLRLLLEAVRDGGTDVEAALDSLRKLPYDDLKFAQIDTHRAVRTGLPEVVFCQGKTAEQVAVILERMAQQHARVLGTRASPEQAAAVQSRLPSARYDPLSRLLSLEQAGPPALAEDAPYACVVAAGTADLPVAEEAAQSLEFFGNRVQRAYDVGVAGLHRLLDKLDLLMEASVVISVAGMEGALTSVVGGLVHCPVIGLPTSVGYGASFGGLAALLAMLNSCAAGVAVVNIDNGFGAAQIAHRILQLKVGSAQTEKSQYPLRVGQPADQAAQREAQGNHDHRRQGELE